MSLNLYLKTNKFDSNIEMAQYFHQEFAIRGFKPQPAEDQDYMYSIQTQIDGEDVIFYMGKNDEESSPPLWQIWPEQRIPLLKKIFGKPDRDPEERAKAALEEIVSAIEGVVDVEWAI